MSHVNVGGQWPSTGLELGYFSGISHQLLVLYSNILVLSHLPMVTQISGPDLSYLSTPWLTCQKYLPIRHSCCLKEGMYSALQASVFCQCRLSFPRPSTLGRKELRFLVRWIWNKIWITWVGSSQNPLTGRWQGSCGRDVEAMDSHLGRKRPQAKNTGAFRSCVNFHQSAHKAT